MQFHDLPTSYHYLKKAGVINPDVGIDLYFKELIAFHVRQKRQVVADEFIMEQWWVQDDQPYYLVYPNIIPVLTKLDLSQVTCSQFVPQRQSLLLRMANGPNNPFRFPAEIQRPDGVYEMTTCYVRNVLVLDMTTRTTACDRACSIWVDIGEEMTLDIRGFLPPCLWHPKMFNAAGLGHRRDAILKLFNTGQINKHENWVLALANEVKVPFKVHTYRNIPLDDDVSLSEALVKLPWDVTATMGTQMPISLMDQITKLVIAISMIDSGDTFLLEPDILQKDELKYRDRELTPEELEKYQAKAKQRGKFGWHLGRQYHEEHARKRPGTPYVVPPHPMHFWVGQGRTRCILKTRKGWITEREKLTKVPTGYEGKESNERQA